MADSGSGCVSATADDKALRGWRDHLPIHPAADLFPLVSEPELRELGEDIKANGLRSSIVLFKGKLLDGRNRLDAMELVGIKFGFLGNSKQKFRGLHACDGSDIFNSLAGVIDHFDGDPYAFVLSANLHRRHLTSEQKRDLIAKVLKARPEASNATVAKQTKTTDKTVAKVRRKMESRSEIPNANTRTDSKGRKQPSAKPKKSAKPAAPPPINQPAAGSAEISIEQRRANARLDESRDDDIVNRAIPLVAAMDDEQRRQFHDQYIKLYGVA